MGRSPCCSKEGLNRGAWTALEDKILTDYIKVHGEGRWRNLPKKAGLKRCGKSCRLRWLNYLRPDIKRGNITHDEEELIIRLHKLLGNRWSLIAGRLPGRTDNEIKNYWNTNLGKKVQENQSTRNQQPSTPSERQKNMVIDPHVVRAKAMRCSTAIQNFHQNVHLEQKTMAKDEGQKPHSMLSESDDKMVVEDENGSEFVLDLNMGEVNLSELLNCDFSADLGGLNYSNDNSTNDWSPSPDQPLLFSEQMMDDWTNLTDRGTGQPNVASHLDSSFSSLLDPEEDWLGV